MWLLCLVWLHSIKLCVLCCRWAAEPAAARRSDRDHLSKERLGACQRGSGLSADTHRGQPLSQMTWGPEPGSSHCLTRASAYISMCPLCLPHQPASCCPNLLHIHGPLKLKTAPHNGWLPHMYVLRNTTWNVLSVKKALTGKFLKNYFIKICLDYFSVCFCLTYCKHEANCTKGHKLWLASCLTLLSCIVSREVKSHLEENVLFVFF